MYSWLQLCSYFKTLEALCIPRIYLYQEILAQLTDCDKKLTEFERLSQDACQFSSAPGREAINLLYKNLAATVDGVQKRSDVTLERLQHCLKLWSDFERESESLRNWLEEMEKRIDATRKVTKGNIESLEIQVNVIQVSSWNSLHIESFAFWFYPFFYVLYTRDWGDSGQDLALSNKSKEPFSRHKVEVLPKEMLFKNLFYALHSLQTVFTL